MESRFLIAVGGAVLRYGLASILLWFGAFKLTEAEAKAIEPLIGSSPLTSWLYAVAEPRTVSAAIGSLEIAVGLLVALRPASAFLSAIGSLTAVGVFLMTLSFLVTTPGTFLWVEGFFVPSETGAFLIKDFFLLGAALWTAGEALGARRMRPSSSAQDPAHAGAEVRAVLEPP